MTWKFGETLNSGHCRVTRTQRKNPVCKASIMPCRAVCNLSASSQVHVHVYRLNLCLIVQDTKNLYLDILGKYLT